jgi:hypothetical protein
MSGKSEDTPETALQRAQTQLALNKVQDYKKRWLPLQKNLAQHISEMAPKDSQARREARGIASTSTEAQFADARTGLESNLAQSGGLGSSKAKLSIAGMGEDEAASTGLGLAGADQRIDDAYVSGLSTIMALGQGQEGMAMKGTADEAAMSGRQATADARMSLEHRMGNAQLVGQLAGAGVGLMKPGAMDSAQAAFSNTSLGSSGFGSGLAYGNQDLGLAL